MLTCASHTKYSMNGWDDVRELSSNKDAEIKNVVQEVNCSEFPLFIETMNSKMPFTDRSSINFH